MPTYFATGVTASLAICELGDSVSNVVDFQCGQEQHADADRMKKALDGATTLSERLLKGEGANDSVVQFLGVHADMPMKMVVASMRGSFGGEDTPDADDEEITTIDPVLRADAAPSSGIDSPLTSLATTPTRVSFNTSPMKAASGAAMPTTTMYDTDYNYPTGVQGLVLNLNLTTNSFMPAVSQGVRRQMYDNKDLKVEIFMNGELVEVDFVSGRKLTKQKPTLSLRYMGKRIHRQVEKPFAYVPSHINRDAVQDAPGKWNAIAATLQRESELRGRDKHGDVSPSAEYLMALSHVALPDHIKDSRGLGVLDVIITAGRGQKYGAEVEYLTGPSRMDDEAYGAWNETIDPDLAFDRTIMQLDASLFISDDSGSSPEVPLAQIRTRSTKYELTTPQARSEKTAKELKESLGLDIDLKKARIDGFENSRGKGNGKGRSLDQRLGDIKKMSPAKQQKEIAKLREEFGEQPAKKKLKVNVPTTSLAPEVTMSPMDMFMPSTPSHLHAQSLSQANNVDDQPQSSTADAQGSDLPSLSSPTGHGLSQIHAKALSTPRKRTSASALAHSPAHVPVKIPKSWNKPQNQQRESGAGAERLDDTPIPFNIDGPTLNRNAATKAARLQRQATLVLSDGTPSRGAGRTAKSWYPNERTAAQVLAEFEVPALSVGSCVTYAPDLGVAAGGRAAVGGKVRRQIMKSRKGEFREQEVVVGMRFCVV